MAKFISMYSKPEDVEGFEEYYRSTHMPIVERWPNVESMELTRCTSTPRGGDPDWHLITVVRFDSMEGLQDAFRSDPGAESARDARAMAERFGVKVSMAVAEDF